MRQQLRLIADQPEAAGRIIEGTEETGQEIEQNRGPDGPDDGIVTDALTVDRHRVGDHPAGAARIEVGLGPGAIRRQRRRELRPLDDRVLLEARQNLRLGGLAEFSAEALAFAERDDGGQIPVPGEIIAPAQKRHRLM